MRFDNPSAILLVALLSVGCGSAFGTDIYVIAGPDVRLSPDDIRELYLGDKEFSGEVRLVPVDNQAAYVANVHGLGPLSETAGRPVGRASADQAEIARLRRQLDTAERKLARTETALQIMGKAQALLEDLYESADTEPKSTR